MCILPAIDLLGGRVVRLYQGNYQQQTHYAVEPVPLAREYAEAGASWLHVVDLDGARAGRQHALETLSAIGRSKLRIQAGGGVREIEDVERLLDVGVERVVIGSLAVRDPRTVLMWLDRFGPEHLTVALDTRYRDGVWRLPSDGWEREEQASLDELAPRYAAAGVRHLLCTDIDRDGAFAGPNLELLAHLRNIAPQLDIQVSGGVRSLQDLHAAALAGAAGIVLGRALLEGRFTLRQALATSGGDSC